MRSDRAAPAEDDVSASEQTQTLTPIAEDTATTGDTRDLSPVPDDEETQTLTPPEDPAAAETQRLTPPDTEETRRLTPPEETQELPPADDASAAKKRVREFGGRLLRLAEPPPIDAETDNDIIPGLRHDD